MSDSGAPQQHSNPSSEISIEEIGAEEVMNEKDKDAEEIITDDSVKPEDHASGDSKDEDKEKKEEEEVIEEIVTPPARIPQEIRDMLDENEDELEDDDDDDFEDETVLERLAGLAEMFPDSLRRGVCSLASGSVSGVKWAYGAGRSLSWVVFSSGAILFLPAMIETERMSIEEMQKAQQRQILLGPGAAVSGGAAGAAQNAPLPSM